MNLKFQIECPDCGGSGEIAFDCICLSAEAVCFCTELAAPDCPRCKGRGFLIVSHTDDPTALPVTMVAP
jgi:hypothetical protein